MGRELYPGGAWASSGEAHEAGIYLEPERQTLDSERYLLARWAEELEGSVAGSVCVAVSPADLYCGTSLTDFGDCIG